MYRYIYHDYLIFYNCTIQTYISVLNDFMDWEKKWLNSFQFRFKSNKLKKSDLFILKKSWLLSTLFNVTCITMIVSCSSSTWHVVQWHITVIVLWSSSTPVHVIVAGDWILCLGIRDGVGFCFEWLAYICFFECEYVNMHTYLYIGYGFIRSLLTTEI